MAIDVACAVIQNQLGEYLCVQRANGKMMGKWEFPGGKLEPKETAFEACVRELQEELDIHVKAEELLLEHTELIRGEVYRLLFVKAEILSGEVTLKEHQNALWLEASELTQLDWLDGDWTMVHRLSGL
jgi:8-oxo-dGTP diphosphatase